MQACCRFHRLRLSIGMAALESTTCENALSGMWTLQPTPYNEYANQQLYADGRAPLDAKALKKGSLHYV